ncbi:hypothetical protein Glove_350g59 [Diversispora epigaea]|uniref:Uncharacterized protein n=1 Tax=Diversispora epigaea TaxID=1348612 RepID=A0A397HI41_9GLOM|nr:hypothetical protein Glove_350g59 [Diversispora epigaea]
MAHSNVLKFRSSYFSKGIRNIQSNENNRQVKHFSKDTETRFIFDLMLATNEIELEELINKLETLLIGTKGSG